MTRRQQHIESIFPEELKRANRFIESVYWREAKSYSEKAPHQYCTLNKVAPEHVEDYHFFCKFIKDAGIVEYFFKTPYKYLHLGEWKYWTMEKVGETPILINRALIKHVYDSSKGETQVSEQ